jgi:hypothetical protein
VRAVAAIALGLIAIAFAWTWAYGNPYSDDACLDARVPEGSGYQTEATIWPPGGECVWEARAGREHTHQGPVPWFEWTFLALCAAAVLLFTRLWRRLMLRVHSRRTPE